jgi:hypothetical protein
MFPHRYRTLVGFVQAWSCACIDIPGREGVPPIDVCLADLLSLRVMGMPDYQWKLGNKRVPYTEMVKVGDLLTYQKAHEWQSVPRILVKEIRLTQDIEYQAWEAGITYVNVAPDGSESGPWGIGMREAQSKNWMIIPKTENN